MKLTTLTRVALPCLVAGMASLASASTITVSAAQGFFNASGGNITLPIAAFDTNLLAGNLTTGTLNSVTVFLTSQAQIFFSGTASNGSTTCSLQGCSTSGTINADMELDDSNSDQLVFSQPGPDINAASGALAKGQTFAITPNPSVNNGDPKSSIDGLSDISGTDSPVTSGMFQYFEQAGGGNINVILNPNSDFNVTLHNVQVVPANNVQNVNANVTIVYDYTPGTSSVNSPEPGTLALFGFGLIGIGLVGRKRFAR